LAQAATFEKISTEVAFYVTKEAIARRDPEGTEPKSIAIAKVFLKFLRELHGLLFLPRRRHHRSRAPSEVLEERLANAAETVLAEQIGSESGDELLAPAKKDDDPIALEEPS
jgi:hypothetical protein